MKRSEIPTAYILVRAETTDQWDECEFAIVHIDKQWKDTMRARIKLLSNFDKHFDSISYGEMPVGFYRRADTAECSLIHNILLDGEDWAYILIDEMDLKNNPAPQNQLADYRFILLPDRYGYYRALSISSEGEYTTEEINLRLLLNP